MSMPQPLKPLLMLVCAAALIGCGNNKPKAEIPKIANRYQTLPAKNVPVWMQGSILQLCDLYNSDPYPVSGFGVISNLRGTGDSYTGTAVHEYIRKQMITHGFGSYVQGFENMQPEQILKDPRFAIIRVDALVPPGARKGQRFDVYVSALEGNKTSNLTHGDLYRTDLKVDGANYQDPGYTIDVWATGEGSIFVNPAYALQTKPDSSDAGASLRRGVVQNGGIVQINRPLDLRLRTPQLSISRNIQYRINEEFQDTTIASAKDEGIVSVFVPTRFEGDWEHFSQVVMHTFINDSPDFAVVKARQLTEEAVKPDAPLMDISYCWEALGPTTIQFYAPLMTSDKPEVAFAAARAAAYLGDGSAQTVLIQMAQTKDHPFQVNAVQTLAKLPSSPVINQMLRTLLNSDKATVRFEAYRALADSNDPAIISQTIAHKFILDIVPSDGPPMIYATRTGLPRIAIFGKPVQMDLPVLFSAMDNRLTISSDQAKPVLNIFYRDPQLLKPVSVISSPNAVQLIARLGGEVTPGDAPLNFSYCEVVALIQAMADQKCLVAAGDQRQPVAFVLQESPALEQMIQQAPIIPDQPPPPANSLGSADTSGMSVGQVR